MATLSYANDIKISCPTIHGLNCMLDICNEFACHNLITFNSNTTALNLVNLFMIMNV